MNISAISYSNNPSGYIYEPVVNKDFPENIPDAAKTGNDTANDFPPSTSKDIETRTDIDTNTRMINGKELTREQIQLLTELKQVDTQVRQHEMAHIAAGGRYITSGANFTYQKGPDGRNYAVGGEVGIDTSPVPGDPEATIRKMRQVKSAALAPASPSSQDIRVASKATQASAKALSDLMIMQAKERAASSEDTAFGDLKKAAGSYEKVSQLPEEDTSSFQLAI